MSHARLRLLYHEDGLSREVLHRTIEIKLVLDESERNRRLFSGLGIETFVEIGVGQ